MTQLVVDIPVIETDRLILRAFQEDDVQHVADFFASERSNAVGGPQSPENCWRIVASWLGHWVMRGYGVWAIHHKKDDRAIGMTGIVNRLGWHEPELGWHIYGGYEGAGYAYEAAFAARLCAAERFGLNRVISYIAPDNQRSQTLAKRLGAAFEREDELLGKPVHIYRHPKVGSAAQ